MEAFKAFVVDKNDEGFSAQLKQIGFDDLPEGEVLIRVHYSSVNYKDGLASIEDGQIVRDYPMVPGIDMAGVVDSSSDDRFKPGDKVIATSYEIGVSRFGGFSEYAKVPADYVVPLPETLTLEEAMVYGTAGFTAGLSIDLLEKNVLSDTNKHVLVTGATGGVGSMAVAMLAKRGYEISASSGKAEAADYLKELGATHILSREEVYEDEVKSVDKRQWDACVDPVGGKNLAAVLSKLGYRGGAAVSGLTGGTDVPTSVHPFILRGVQLLGVDSVYCPMEERKLIWERLASDLKPEGLFEKIKNVITLEELPDTLEAILAGENTGRTIVKIKQD